MKEITGDMWEQDCEWLCITTNGIINKNGEAVMGAGVAKQAKLRYPDLPLILADRIRKYGNVVS